MRPVVAIDLDGVLASWDNGTFHKIGPPIPGAAEWTHRLVEDYDLVIYTCRATSALYPNTNFGDLIEDIFTWLSDNGFAYSDVWCGRGKPLAHAYVDDRAVECMPEANSRPLLEFAQATLRINELCAGETPFEKETK